jgi:hypothetical protein
MPVTRDKIDAALASLGVSAKERKTMLGRRSLAKRFMPKSDALQKVLDQIKMATESPLIHDGGQCTLSTTNDARNSTVSGSTLAGPSGSGQFLAVRFSTSLGRTVQLMSTLDGALGSSVAAFYGILQNKPGPAQAVDVGLFGISKAVAGTTTIVAGSLLQTSSTLAGVLSLFAGGNGRPVGMALEPVTAAAMVFTAYLFGGSANAAST